MVDRSNAPNLMIILFVFYKLLTSASELPTQEAILSLASIFPTLW